MNDDGVSDIIGTMLLVAMTVLMMVGLSLVVLSLPGPPDEVLADLRITTGPGSGGWGTGDELVQIQHLGGEPVDGPVRVLLEIAGVTTQINTTGAGFSDGQLTIGETWDTTLTLAEGTEITVGVLDIGGTHMITLADVVAGGTASTPTVPSNTPPAASFTFSCTLLVCTFDGTGSTDIDGSIANWAWDFDGDGTSTGSTTGHTFSADGDYDVSLTVTDNEGAQDVDTQQVSVSAGPPADPGFAYVDTGCNGVYDVGPDTQLASSAVTDGAYDAGNDCLVIPGSVGAISAAGITFAGEGVKIRVSLTATAGDIDIDADASALDLNGITATAADDIFLDCPSCTVTLVGTTLNAQGDDMRIGNSNIPDSIVATNAILSTDDDIVWDSDGPLTIDGATISTAQDGRGADLTFTAGGAISGVGATITMGDDIRLTAGGSMDLTNAVLNADPTRSNRDVELVSTGTLTADGITVDADRRIWFTSSGDIHLDNADLDTTPPDNDIEANLDGPGSTQIHVQDAIFSDSDSNLNLDVNPSGRVVGTPAAGYGVE